jgi:hypothetical protein
MRLAGSVAWRKPNKPGRVNERTEIVRVSRAAREFTVEQLHRVCPPLDRLEAAASVPDVEVQHGGALGLEEKIVDGREGYAFGLIRAHLVEHIGTTGCEPTPDELYRSAWPVYFRKADQVRPGRGPTFFMQKCVECVRAFRSGQIPFAKTLDEAVETYVAKGHEIAREAAGDDEFDEDEPAGDVFEALTIGEIKQLPDADWLIKEAIQRGGLGFMYGAPGSFKSFICYDLALALAYGCGEWIGREAKAAGSVLYLASEGSTGARKRIEAWQRKHGIDTDSDGFRLIRSTISFMQASDVTKLERTVAAIVARSGPVSTIFVDTVSRVLPGADENLQKDMTLFVAACDRLRERFDATVIGVHHTNKAGDMRGSTVFLGQGDFIFRVDKDEDRKGGVLTCEKQKDAEDGWRVAFAVEAHAWTPVGRLQEVSSLTVKFTGDPAPTENELKWPPREVSRAVQRTINEAWMRGKPLSPYPQTGREGRYAVKNIMQEHSLPKAVVEMMLETWQASDVLSLQTMDGHSKAKGLRVLKWID